jgi:hypothetical protein
MDNQEIWKDIPVYEGLYQVSNLGRVKTLERNVFSKGKLHYIQKEKILKTSLYKDGYEKVILQKDKHIKTYKVHTLVAICFLNHKPDGTHKIVVDHIDNNRSNNNLNNLRLISNRENLSRLKRKSKYVGVHWCKLNQKWKAAIWIDGKRKSLGYHLDEYSAHLKYQEELNKLKENVHT